MARGIGDSRAYVRLLMVVRRVTRKRRSLRTAVNASFVVCQFSAVRPSITSRLAPVRLVLLFDDWPAIDTSPCLHLALHRRTQTNVHAS